jgi:ADP-ribose pyrophosphatase
MKIPDNAIKVHKGVIYDVYNWEQRLFDGTTKIFEGIKRRPAVQIFASTTDGIILLEEEQPGQEPYLSVPGGNVESDDILSCAKRELLEETGLSSDDWILWKKIGLGLNIEFDTYYYIARNCQKTSQQSLDKGSERVNVNVLPLQEFLKRLVIGDVRNEVLQSMAILISHDKNKFSEFSEKLLNNSLNNNDN